MYRFYIGMYSLSGRPTPERGPRPGAAPQPRAGLHRRDSTPRGGVGGRCGAPGSTQPRPRRGGRSPRQGGGRVPARIGARRRPLPRGAALQARGGGARGEWSRGGSPLALTRCSSSGGPCSAEPRWPGPRWRRELGGQQRHEEERGGHGQGQVFPLGAGAADALLQLRHLRVEVICGEEREGEGGTGRVAPGRWHRGGPKPLPRGWACPVGSGGGDAALGGRGPDSPRSSIFTSGRRVNCGRVGTGFSPECDAARGREGTGRSRSLPTLRHSPPEGWGTQEGWGTRQQAMPPPAHPQTLGQARGYLLEAQHTNTFIFRQARRWLCVGVAARQEWAGVAPQRATPSRAPPGCLGVRSGLAECSSIAIPLPQAASAPCLLHQHPHPAPAPIAPSCSLTPHPSPQPHLTPKSQPPCAPNHPHIHLPPHTPIPELRMPNPGVGQQRSKRGDAGRPAGGFGVGGPSQSGHAEGSDWVGAMRGDQLGLGCRDTQLGMGGCVGVPPRCPTYRCSSTPALRGTRSPARRRCSAGTSLRT